MLTATSSLNYGYNGLERLDTTVRYAEKYDVKLCVIFIRSTCTYSKLCLAFSP